MINPTNLQQETTPADYIARGRRLVDAINQFKRLRTRISQAVSALTDEERAAHVSRAAKIDEALINLWARSHFEPVSTVLADRTVEVAQTFEQLFDLMDKLGARI